jgi:hypothetical protein
MGIGVVLLFWAIPAAAALAVCVVILRKADAGFRKRRPLTFIAALTVPAVGVAVAAVFATALVLGNSDSPQAAYKAIFEKDAESCTTLLHGKTYLSTDAETAEVVFRSSCPGIAASFEKFQLRPTNEVNSTSVTGFARQYFLAEPDCSTPVIRVGSYKHWRHMEMAECAAHGLYAISASWID